MGRRVWLWLAMVGMAASGFAQGPAAKAAGKVPEFAVVSVKENNGETRSSRWGGTPDGVVMENIPLSSIMLGAYGAKNATEDQLVGLPGWAKDKRYDLQAKVGEEDLAAYKALNDDEKDEMLRKVLEDRFKVKVHHEVRESPVYYLVVAKGGPKLKASTPGDTYENGMKFGGKAAGRGASSMQFGGNAYHMAFQACGIDNPNLLGNLTRETQRQVIDRTGLTGTYDFKLDWSPDEVKDPPLPGLLTALEEELGLKLEPGKGPLDFVVVDHVEQPSAN